MVPEQVKATSGATAVGYHQCQQGESDGEEHTGRCPPGTGQQWRVRFHFRG